MNDLELRYMLRLERSVCQAVMIARAFVGIRQPSFQSVAS